MRRKRLPVLVNARGERELCGFVTRGWKTCVSYAMYPDGRCCVHTSHLEGHHHDRKRRDTFETRSRIWAEWTAKGGPNGSRAGQSGVPADANHVLEE